MITANEWNFTEGNGAGFKLDLFELGAVLEYPLMNSFEVFVTDDAFEGGAMAEQNLFDDFELIGESDTREGDAFLECSRS